MPCPDYIANIEKSELHQGIRLHNGPVSFQEYTRECRVRHEYVSKPRTMQRRLARKCPKTYRTIAAPVLLVQAAMLLSSA